MSVSCGSEGFYEHSYVGPDPAVATVYIAYLQVPPSQDIQYLPNLALQDTTDDLGSAGRDGHFFSLREKTGKPKVLPSPPSPPPTSCLLHLILLPPSPPLLSPASHLFLLLSPLSSTSFHAPPPNPPQTSAAGRPAKTHDNLEEMWTEKNFQGTWLEMVRYSYSTESQ